MSLPQALRAGDKAGPVREAVRQEFQLAPFYAKTIVVGDLPIVGSTNVSAVALRDAFADAKKRGLCKNTYAASNPSKYWAEGVQDWFDDNRRNDPLRGCARSRQGVRGAGLHHQTVAIDARINRPHNVRKLTAQILPG